MTRNGLLPQLDLFVTLGKSGYAASFGGAPRMCAEPARLDALAIADESAPAAWGAVYAPHP